MFILKKFTDHRPLATAPRCAGLQPEDMSAPRREALHHQEPLGGTGVQNEPSIPPETITGYNACQKKVSDYKNKIYGIKHKMTNLSPVPLERYWVTANTF